MVRTGASETTIGSRAARSAAALLLSLTVGPAVAAAQQPVDHPRLVSVEAARCTTCHDELIAAEHVHPPVAEDCTTCHEFEIDDEGTRVALMATGTELCVFCHDLAAEAAGEVATPHFPVVDSCQTCHDPHAAAQPRLLHATQPGLCADCHAVEDLQPVHGGQLTDAVRCTACHAPHGTETPSMLAAAGLHAPFADGDCTSCHRQPFGDRIRLQGRGEAVCTACHGEMSGAEDASVHAALTGEGRRAGCLSCHDPHMSEETPLLAEAIPELCGTCHEPVLAAVGAETGHGVGEECGTCHLPHASPERRLLSERTPELCAVCHDVAGEELTTAHLGADLGSLDCLACHSPHGAGNPSLLAETLHPPIEDGCDLCHEGASDALLDDGASTLCTACHADIEQLATSAEVPHFALELGPCTTCHNPHATPQPKLIKAPGGGACLECHAEQAPADGEVLHGVIEMVGCRACHEPHGSANEFLLRASGPELCLACHGAGAVRLAEGAETVELLGRFPVPREAAERIQGLILSPDGTEGHPVVNHRVLGKPSEEELHAAETTFSGELTCLTCHDPHKGRSARLFRWEAESTVEACQHCHPK